MIYFIMLIIRVILLDHFSLLLQIFLIIKCG